jgi:uncharacterized protein with von Willebrand factor type A (vWA) domain
MFVTPNSEAYIKSGLAKSAFRPGIYKGLPLDFYLPHVVETQRYVSLSAKAVPRLYQAHDAFMAFYQKLEDVLRNLKQSNKAAPAWHYTISHLVRKWDYPRLNDVTAGSTDLAIVAAVKFLAALLGRVDVNKLDEQARSTLQQQGQAGKPGTLSLLNKLLGQAAGELKGAVDEAFGEAKKAAEEYAELKMEGESAARLIAGAGGLGYSLEALSALRFLSAPDEVRRRVKLLRNTVAALKTFSEAVPTSLTHMQTAATYGGIAGVTQLRDLSKIADILPSELALSQMGSAGQLLLALKIAQRQAASWERAAAVKPVVFLDKSGSMAAPLGWGGAVEKIALAAGLALALFSKLDADIYLFDTETEGPIAKRRVVELLLTIQADGGTNATPVLEEILRIGRPDYLYIIISDGITEAEPEVLQRFERSGLARRTRLILVPPGDEGYNWVQAIKRQGGLFYARDVASFVDAAKRALSA